MCRVACFSIALKAGSVAGIWQVRRGNGEKPIEDAVVSMLVISCRWMDTTCPVVSGELGLK